MVDIIFDPEFRKNFKKIKDRNTKQKIIKQVLKIKQDPDIGKPMKYSRKGIRELYISPFRLSFMIVKNKVYILDLYHKDKQTNRNL